MLTAGTADSLLEKLNLNPETARDIREKWKKGDIIGATESVDDQTINAWHLVSSREAMNDKLEELIKFGAKQIVVPASGPDPKKFIERFGKEIVPCF
jgi:ATP phosphoribosyltransferase